ncbi:MAG: polyprenyl synthetase family protein, partial [Phycisphaerae bacterium]
MNRVAKAADIESALRVRREQVTRALEEVLRCPEPALEPLYEPMRYMVLGGGKKLRPCLVLLSSEACGGSADDAMPAACAVEMVHTYSLIHDDLPAMDNDDLRHGRPSCHKAFGEATAILAGDALFTEAFGLLATRVEDAATSRRLVALLASAAGASGMVAGQVADLRAEREDLRDAHLLEEIHRRKTAALLRAACLMGAVCARAPQRREKCLGEYGEHLGLAFQVADDILDAVSETKVLGKTAGKDAAAGKLTFVSLFG